MAENKQADYGFAIFITVLVILLILAIALFIYGSMTNGVPRPQVPGKGLFALGSIVHHG